MGGGHFEPSTSISLIRRARALEPEAWDVLTRLYGPLIYGWARKSGLQAEDAADILQTVFVSVWRGLPAYAADRPDSSFRGWLRIITRNALASWGRERRVKSVPSGRLDASSPPMHTLARAEADASDIQEDDLFSDLTHQALEIVRQTVDARTWEAFWKVTVEEQEVAEVAAALGMSPPAVRQAKYRVLCRLREMLADQ